MHVVVVESPAKARTLRGCLGPGHEVIATRGHVRDLAAKDGSVDPARGFAMAYATKRGAARALGAIAAALIDAEALVLATDPDREGEAIAWQVLEWLRERGALEGRAVRRVVFHEITPEAVREAMARPRGLDMSLVRAQQARRALDYLVGFHLSALLWRKVRGGRSAGRVQSVALRLLCAREAEIEAFEPEEYWTVDAAAMAERGGAFTFDDSGATTGAKGRVESTMTTVSPYARLNLTERVSAWSLAGLGTGDMSIAFDDGTDAVRTDLSMRLGALGARGELLRQDEAVGMDLVLKADAFFVRMESEKAANSAATQADASRLRLVLEGGRSFDMGGGATLRPSLELGVRHDGGDAETGAGLEVGGAMAYADPSSGLSLEARARMLVAHADSDYEEWGASATARLDPGGRGRGLSFSLAPTIGATSSASERLWGARDARALAPGAEFDAGRGLQGEMGYGMSLFGGGFTGTPNLGFGMSDGGARDWRIGWRLTSAVEGDPGFEVNLDAIRREAANDDAVEHGVMLRGAVRW